MFSKKGLIDIKEYLSENYNYNYRNNQDLLEQSFISYETQGASALFWIKDKKGKEYLFKKSNIGVVLGELLSYKVGEILGYKVAKARYAKLGDVEGILSLKFTKENELIIPGAQIIQDTLNIYANEAEPILENKEFLELYNIPQQVVKAKGDMPVKLLSNYLNNLEEIWSILEYYLYNRDKESAQELTKVYIEYLVDQLFFDIFTMQADRHCENWGIGYDQNNDKLISIPFFDNSASFRLFLDDLDKEIEIFYKTKDAYDKKKNPKKEKEFINHLYKGRLLFTESEDSIINISYRKRLNNIEIVDNFLRKSDRSFQDKFISQFDKFKNIDMDSLLTDIELENGLVVSDKVKKYIIDVNSINCELMNSVVANYRRGNKNEKHLSKRYQEQDT